MSVVSIFRRPAIAPGPALGPAHEAAAIRAQGKRSIEVERVFEKAPERGCVRIIWLVVNA
jgi:hypothetical protein